MSRVRVETLAGAQAHLQIGQAAIPWLPPTQALVDSSRPDRAAQTRRDKTENRVCPISDLPPRHHPIFLIVITSTRPTWSWLPSLPPLMRPL